MGPPLTPSVDYFALWWLWWFAWFGTALRELVLSDGDALRMRMSFALKITDDRKYAIGLGLYSHQFTDEV